MDSLELKVPASELQAHLEKVRQMSSMDKPIRKAKENKAPEEQRKINTRGIKNANKVMLMSAKAYNLKKYLKFTKNEVETAVKQVRKAVSLLFERISLRLSHSKALVFSVHKGYS